MQYLYERVRSEDGTERYAAQYFVKRSLSPEMKAELKKFDSRLLWYNVMSGCIWLLLLLAGIVIPVLGLDRLLTYLCGLLFFGFILFIQPIFRKLFFPEKKENELLARCREEMNVSPDAEKMEIIYPVRIEKHGWINGNHKGYICTSNFVHFYMQEQTLCIASPVDVIQIPWSSLSSIEAEEKGRLMTWIQRRTFRSLKKYRVKKHAANNYSICFHRIIIRDAMGEFYFCLPNYEIEKFCEMTKMYINEA
ncbi:MAG: hypothetical protein IJ496_10960 [Ruminococcus sp.]|nr:hypothetical protein [Ruminococcus sp.]